MQTREKREYIVVSVGGSLIVPDGIDVSFLKQFRELVIRKIGEGFGFYIITGGGKIARQWRDAAVEVNPETSDEDLDCIGIAACRLNANVVRGIFANPGLPPVILDTRQPIDFDSSLLFAGGVRPGNSSDWAAVEAAKAVGTKKLVNLSNIDYVYTADPRKEPAAKKIERISWAEFRKLLPETWDPGLSAPFDPVAAKEAEALRLEVAIINGARLEEFENYISEKPFMGTVVS